VAHRRRVGHESGWGRDGLGASIAQDQGDALLAGEGGELADLGVGRAEARAGQQVASVVVAHRGGRGGGAGSGKRKRGGDGKASRHGSSYGRVIASTAQFARLLTRVL